MPSQEKWQKTNKVAIGFYFYIISVLTGQVKERFRFFNGNPILIVGLT